MLECKVIDELAALERYEADWDRLAVAASRPLCRPAWLRAWWGARCPIADHPARALRVAVATDGGDGLLAVVPMFMASTQASVPTMHMLGAREFWNAAPLLSPLAPPHTLEIVARVLRETTPRAARVSFTTVARHADWPHAIASGWRAVVRTDELHDALVISGAPSFADWLAAHPRQWRSEIRRRERRATEQGFRVTCAENSEVLARDLAALARLHHARWDGRQGWLWPGFAEKLGQAAGELFAGGGVRLWAVKRDNEVIGATLFARAGNASQVLLTGFDPCWSSLAPGLLSNIAGIRGQLEDGNRTIDFGWGAFPYKQALAPDREPLARFELLPGTPAARARRMAQRVRRVMRVDIAKRI